MQTYTSTQAAAEVDAYLNGCDITRGMRTPADMAQPVSRLLSEREPDTETLMAQIKAILDAEDNAQN